MEILVRHGDTLWSYSQWFQVPLDLITDSNPNINPNQLYIGQPIQIPGFITEDYVVRSGDTFWGIAQRNQLNVQALIVVNPTINPNSLQINSRITVPKKLKVPVVNGNQSYDFSQMQEDISRLRTLYPFIKLETVGYSVLGKPLYEITVGKGQRVVHFNGSFHANEWITTPVIMQLLNEYLLALVNGNAIRGVLPLPLYFRNTLSLVPMVNPDGVDLVLNGPPDEVREQVLSINKGSTNFSDWKANIRGVDLNNQYPANWEIEKERKEPKSPAPRDYPGDAPLTEPEAMAMALLAQNRQFSRLIAFHTQGSEFYWGYEGYEPPESEVLAREFSRVSGYNSVRNIDSHAGYKDWFILIYRRPGFTMELGQGVNPIPISQFPKIYQEMLGVFLVALYL